MCVLYGERKALFPFENWNINCGVPSCSTRHNSVSVRYITPSGAGINRVGVGVFILDSVGFSFGIIVSVGMFVAVESESDTVGSTAFIGTETFAGLHATNIKIMNVITALCFIFWLEGTAERFALPASGRDEMRLGCSINPKPGNCL